jgi:hypothetical protein
MEDSSSTEVASEARLYALGCCCRRGAEASQYEGGPGGALPLIAAFLAILEARRDALDSTLITWLTVPAPESWIALYIEPLEA